MIDKDVRQVYVTFTWLSITLQNSLLWAIFLIGLFNGHEALCRDWMPLLDLTSGYADLKYSLNVYVYSKSILRFPSGESFSKGWYYDVLDVFKISPIAPKASNATVDAKITEMSLHFPLDMKDPANNGTAAPNEKQIIDDNAACTRISIIQNMPCNLKKKVDSSSFCHYDL